MPKLAATKRVLLVEDNPDDEFLALRALQSAYANCVVETARNGAEAIAYVRNITHSLDLILLDLKLPKVDGLAVLETFRGISPALSTPIVVLSTSLEQKDLLRCYELGANSYVRKPVDFGDFTKLVEVIAHYWLDWNEQPLASRLEDEEALW